MERKDGIWFWFHANFKRTWYIFVKGDRINFAEYIPPRKSYSGKYSIWSEEFIQISISSLETSSVYFLFSTRLFSKFYSKVSVAFTINGSIYPRNSQQMLMTDFISNELRADSILNISLQQYHFLEFQVTWLRNGCFEIK